MSDISMILFNDNTTMYVKNTHEVGVLSHYLDMKWNIEPNMTGFIPCFTTLEGDEIHIDITQVKGVILDADDKFNREVELESMVNSTIMGIRNQ